MKTAILQVSDTGPLESLVDMLSAVGYTCFTPDNGIKTALRQLGCDTVLDIDGLVENWGYERPAALPLAGMTRLRVCDLYVDIKAHRNGPILWSKFPELEKKTLWYRINGGRPEHVIKLGGFDCGDEINPPCPVLTPNRWYADTSLAPSWKERAYSFWPSFCRWDSYWMTNKRHYPTAPVCLTHNLAGWGYGKLMPAMQELGVKLYGRGSPDGLINHRTIPHLLSTAQALVHLKSSDAPGYSLYEAIAAKCPLILPRRLVWRNRMEDLFEEGITYLAFDRETHDSLTDEDVDSCKDEIAKHLDNIPSDIAENAYDRLLKLMWDRSRTSDLNSLSSFLTTNFG